jgi:hypothetical protein
MSTIIKRVDFNHKSSFKVDKIENLINKMEKKFNCIEFVKLRCTVEGRGLTRISTIDKEKCTVKLLLPHKYTKNNKQAKILLGFVKNLVNILELWLKKNV